MMTQLFIPERLNYATTKIMIATVIMMKDASVLLVWMDFPAMTEIFVP